MKKLILILNILFISIFANSQEYVPFDFDNGEWYCRYVTKGGMFSAGHGTYYATDSVKFFCSGDTIINDTLYKKLYYEGYSSSQIVTKTYISGYYGAIRNDNIKKQVWFYIDNASFLIYDFNITKGDSICNTVQYNLPITFYFCGNIESIDSVSYCNKYFKKYNIENNHSIIEGIGSDKGLFPVKSETWYSNLICYMEKSNNGCESCKITFTNIVNNSVDERFIYVNQTNNQLHIFSEYSMKSIDLIDMSGRIIIKVNSLNCNSTDLYLTHKGIFIVKVKTDDKIFIKKIDIK